MSFTEEEALRQRQIVNQPPNLRAEIPTEGYNFSATCFLMRHMAEKVKDCGFAETRDFLLEQVLNDKLDTIDFAVHGVIEGNKHQKVCSNDIGMHSTSNEYLRHMIFYTLLRSEKARRFVLTLTLSFPPKEPHGVALCVDVDRKNKKADFIILEQHAQNKETDGDKYEKNLDYSNEIKGILEDLKKDFTYNQYETNTFYNTRPICQEKHVCGVVSLELCRRLLEADDPIIRNCDN